MSQENFTPGSTRLCKFKKRGDENKPHIDDDILTSNNQYHQAKDAA